VAVKILKIAFNKNPSRLLPNAKHRYKADNSMHGRNNY